MRYERTRINNELKLAITQILKYAYEIHMTQIDMTRFITSLTTRQQGIISYVTNGVGLSIVQNIPSRPQTATTTRKTTHTHINISTIDEVRNQ